MVPSDGAASTSRQRLGYPHRLAVVLAVLALTGGVWGLGSLTRPENPPVVEAVPVPSVPEDAGPDWERVADFPKSAVYALTQIGDEVVVFASTPQTTERTLTGLHLWRSDDGLSWEQGSSVIASGSRIQSVTSTALGIVALGFAPFDDSLRAWLSGDGHFWLPLAEGLPLDTDGLANSRTRVAGDETALVREDLSSLIGDDASVVDMAVKDERGIALVTRTPDKARPYDIARFEIWAAPIS